MGFRYFVTFVDDYYRLTWLFLMKERSEVFEIFKKLCVEDKTQFGHSICILRSDNAKEYFSIHFSNYLQASGILHQSSCSHTPQQNGVAERKNHHLLEIARCLLLHMNIPRPFWRDAILTACFFINRMPSSILHGATPFSVLFLINLHSIYHHEFLDVSHLFINLPLVLISLQLGLTNVSSWVILDSRKDIAAIVLLFGDTLCVLMSPSWSPHHIMPLQLP